MEDNKSLVVIVRGYPRTDEIFIAQELVHLEKTGLKLELFSLVKPEEFREQAVHRELKAKVHYVPTDSKLLKNNSVSFMIRNPIKWLELLIDFRPLLIEKKSFKRFYQAIWVYQKVTKTEKSIVYSHFANSPTEVARGVALLLNANHYVFAHAKDIFTVPMWLLKERLSRVVKVFSCNQRNVNYLSSIHPRVELVYHGLTTRYFNQIDKEFQNKMNFYSAGRLVEKKGYFFILNVLSKLKNRGLIFHYTIFGDGELREKLEAYVKELSLEDNVTFFGEYTLREYSEKIRPGDIFLGGFLEDKDSGDRDGLPNTLLEAMYFGAIVVTTYSDAINEVVRHNVNGHICENNEDAFVDQILALKDRDLRKISEQASRTIKDNFLFENCVKKLEAHLK